MKSVILSIGVLFILGCSSKEGSTEVVTQQDSIAALQVDSERVGKQQPVEAEAADTVGIAKTGEARLLELEQQLEAERRHADNLRGAVIALSAILFLLVAVGLTSYLLRLAKIAKKKNMPLRRMMNELQPVPQIKAPAADNLRVSKRPDKSEPAVIRPDKPEPAEVKVKDNNTAPKPSESTDKTATPKPSESTDKTAASKILEETDKTAIPKSAESTDKTVPVPKTVETVRTVASETVRTVAPETVRTVAPETVRTVAPESVAPKTVETVRTVAPESVAPKTVRTVKTVASEPVETVKTVAETVTPKLSAAPETLVQEPTNRVRQPDLFGAGEAAIPSERPAAPKPSAVNDDQERLFRTMDSRIREERLYANVNFQRQDVLELFGISRATLNQLLNTYADGQSFPVYINSIRLEEACDILEKDAQKNISDIAVEVGLAPHNFYRLFQQRFGQTPVQYRLSRKG